MEVPVYLFTGVMDSGKTSLITQTLLENDFGAGARTLILACEDGDVEYDEEKLQEMKAIVVGVSSQEEFTKEYLEDCDKTLKPDQVFIEYNGTWDAATILEMELPKDWEIVQSLATVDASTFEMYLNNMRAMMMEQVFHTDVVIFNRCTEDTPKGKFRRTIKAINRKAQIVYEREDGTIDQSDMEELPYDITQKEIEITDADYGIFYLDVQEEPKKYEGKTVRFKCRALVRKKLPEKTFIVGRHVMTCCVEDIQFAGLVCQWEGADTVQDDSWMILTAKINFRFNRAYGKKGPVLTYVDSTLCDAPEQPVATFY